MGTLTKRELVVRISNETGLVQGQVLQVIQRTLDIITDSLAQGESVELRNFGIMEVRLTQPRVGRNPKQPGSSFAIPARATVKFKAGKVMDQKVFKLTAAMKRQANAKKKAAMAATPVIAIKAAPSGRKAVKARQ
jgi:nucleoid DNA-binding protein